MYLTLFRTPRFKGFQQQDSHELLRHLLDGMKAEEVKVSDGPIYSKTCFLRVPTVCLEFVRKRQVSTQQRSVMITRQNHEINGHLQKLSTNERCPPNRVSVKNRFYCN